MFDKLMAAQQKADEIKKRLDTIPVEAEVEGGKIRVTATANKVITGIAIDEAFLKEADKEGVDTGSRPNQLRINRGVSGKSPANH